MNIPLKLIIFYIVLITFSNSSSSTDLSNEEKMNYMKDAIPPCIAKQSANRGMLSADEKKALKDYCSCHASVMGSNITKEEMLQVSKGSLPNSLPPKIKEAQKRCVEALLK